MAKRRRSPRSVRRMQGGQDSYWTELNLRIRSGEVIPIISNSVRNDRIFDFDYNHEFGPADGDIDARRLTVDEELAEEWSEEIGYPMTNRHLLARVAVYNRIKSDDDQQAKRKYLRFLKEYLLDIAEEDEDVSDLVDELRSQVDILSFSAIASQMDRPQYKDVRTEDPLRLLARLPLAVYVTTSYYDFLERALQAEGRTPHTQISFLFGEPRDVAPGHRPDPDIVPSPEEPLVYHLHGFERYPESLVLSEDDYLDFLARVSEESGDSSAPFIPLYLSAALAESSLILLGYSLHDWDFRVLFRGMITPKHGALRKFSLAIQLDPVEQGGIINAGEARNYLKKYFEPIKFRVEWNNVDDFIKQMYQIWNEWRKG
jgi:hypothetical protein